MARKFLITRNKKFAEKTKKDLLKQKISSITAPLYEIKNLPIDHHKFKNSSIILTSKNATNNFNKSEILKINKKNEFLLVGESFYYYLKSCGLSKLQYFVNSRALLEYIVQNKGQYHYLRGAKISLNLKQYVPDITEQICYEVIYYQLEENYLTKLIKEHQVTDLLFFSQENAKYFIKNIDKSILLDLNIFCLSKRIAEVFTGFSKNIIYPDTPTYMNLIKCLVSH